MDYRAESGAGRNSTDASRLSFALLSIIVHCFGNAKRVISIKIAEVLQLFMSFSNPILGLLNSLSINKLTTALKIQQFCILVLVEIDAILL